MSPPTPPKDPAVGPFEHRFAPSLHAVRGARRALACWLEILPGVDVDGIDDLLIVCSELTTNAVRHSADVSGSVAVRAFVDGDSVVLEVEDTGAGFTWPVAHGIEDVLVADENGRGLFIVEALTDRLEVVTDGGRTVVRCTKRALLRQPVTSGDPALSARFRADAGAGAASRDTSSSH